jgi:hypothetical protein
VHGVGAFGLSWFAERLGRMSALRAHSAKDRFWRLADVGISSNVRFAPQTAIRAFFVFKCRNSVRGNACTRAHLVN